jgi:nucleoside-diphosphate-sugar epimerase
MTKTKVMILGAKGFVGKNLANSFKNDGSFDLYQTTSRPDKTFTYVDILKPESWEILLAIEPNIIIDATGYGVVKYQSDLSQLYNTNYLEKRVFFEFVYLKLPSTYWIQIGTAFEYSLEQENLTEDSLCFPRTHYGISKLLFSNYLQGAFNERFTILRPFGMFGEGEDISKFFPLLIQAQKQKKRIDLTDGSQIRDYFYINDLCDFILGIIASGQLKELEGQIINVGSGVPKTIREFSSVLANEITDFDPTFWNWGAIGQRQGENNIFYNASTKAKRLGLRITALNEAFRYTVNYYYNL